MLGHGLPSSFTGGCCRRLRLPVLPRERRQLQQHRGAQPALVRRAWGRRVAFDFRKGTWILERGQGGGDERKETIGWVASVSAPLSHPDTLILILEHCDGLHVLSDDTLVADTPPRHMDR